MNDIMDMKISGSSAMPGGEYRTVSISGSGIFSCTFIPNSAIALAVSITLSENSLQEIFNHFPVALSLCFNAVRFPYFSA